VGGGTPHTRGEGGGGAATVYVVPKRKKGKRKWVVWVGGSNSDGESSWKSRGKFKNQYTFVRICASKMEGRWGESLLSKKAARGAN